MNRNKKRFKNLSLILILTMMLSLLPAAAWADAAQTNDSVQDSASVESGDSLTPSEPEGEENADQETTDSGEEDDQDINAPTLNDQEVPDADDQEQFNPNTPAEDDPANEQPEQDAEETEQEETAELTQNMALVLLEEVGDKLTPNNTDAWQTIIDENDTINIEAGTYEELNAVITGDKTFIVQGDVELQGSSEQIAFVVESGTLTVTGGSLAVSGYNMAVKTQGASDKAIVLQDTVVTIDDGYVGFYLSGEGNVSLTIGSAAAASADPAYRVTEDDAVNRAYSTKLNVANQSHGAVYAGEFSTGIDVNLTISDAEVHLNDNGFSGYYADSGVGKTTAVIQNSCCTMSHNSGTGFAFGANENGSILTVGNSYVELSDNGANGINGGKQTYLGSTIAANANQVCNIEAYSVEGQNSVITANGALTGYGIWSFMDDAFFRLEACDVTAKDNARTGLFLYAGGTINHSTISTSGNGSVGIQAKKQVETKDSVLMLRDDTARAYSLYKEDAQLLINSNTVGAFQAGEFAIGGSLLASQQTVVVGGSLQGNQNKMTGEYGDTLNGSKAADEVYIAPINADGTKLTPFALHRAVNAEVGEPAGLPGEFIYYDPAERTVYPYAFRFNEAGEDLEEGASGSAYVWTPVSLIHYDAAESELDQLGTAQASDKRYASDTTIYGNSLRLAERQQPAWAAYIDADGNTHTSGWYVHTENGRVADISDRLPDSGSPNACETWDEFYALLDTPFTAATKICSNFHDPATAIEEITVYAKWTMTPPVPPTPPTPTDPVNPVEPSDPGDYTPTEPTVPGQPVVIPDVHVPLAEIPAVPMVEVPAEVIIPDEEAPLAETPITDNPKTGQAEARDLSAIALLLAAGALGIELKRKKA